ncbi:MAG: glucose-1-phosphate cytidylyltransferase [bacterium]|nr:glucose-1-phosphate cytidylyltransferase [bacterium]
MKVVLFCGGLGMRLRDYSDRVPKPMALIGNRPILWHVMKYYASYGHKDFILCLGYKADVIKDYFVNYQEYVSNDFVLRGAECKVSLLRQDIHEWNITFCDTGFSASIGERLRSVRRHLAGEDMFLANYADNLTNFHLPDMIEHMRESDNVAGFVAVRPPHSFHIAHIDQDMQVTGIEETSRADLWINGGYFALRPAIFDYMNKGEEIVVEPFDRLIAERKLLALKFKGFWQNMDTFKDRTELNDLHAQDEAPWEIWKRSA